jgi:hypothetical protein
MHSYIERARSAMLICALIASIQPVPQPLSAAAPAAVAARPLHQTDLASITLTPDNAQTGSPDIALVIGLTGFQTDSAKSVMFGPTPLTVVLTDTSTLTATLPATNLLTAGYFPVVVSEVAGTTATRTFTVSNPAPTAALFSPATMQAGQAVAFVITGTGYSASTTATLGSNALTISAWTPTQLTAQLASGVVTRTGLLPLTVYNPAPGGGSASPGAVTIGADVPATMTLAPMTTTVAASGTIAYSVIVTDAYGNTPTGQSVSWTTNPDAVQSTVSGALTATVRADTRAASHARAVTATLSANPALQQTAGFTIQSLGIASISVSPATRVVSPNVPVALTAIARDVFGNVLSEPINWSFSAAGTATPGNPTSAVTYTPPTTARAYYITATAQSNGAIFGTATVTVTPGNLQTIAVSPVSAVLPPSTTQVFNATGSDAHGNVIPGLVFNWTNVGVGGTFLVANPTSSTLYRTNIVAGSYTIRVRSSPGPTNTLVSVTVNPGPLARIVVTPTGVTLAPNGTQAYTAAGFDQYDNYVPGVSFAWSVDAAYSGKMSFSGNTLTAGTQAGNYPNAVIATSGAITGRGNVAISTASLASMTLTPESTSLSPNGTQTFVAKAFDAFSNEITQTAFAWSVTGAGTLVAFGPTTATLRATSTAGTYVNSLTASVGALNRSATITVVPGVVNSVRITPNPATLAVNEAASFTATAYDANNNPVPNQSFAWSTEGGGSIESSSSTSATFRAGTDAGAYANALVATAAGKSDGVTITVLPGPAASLRVSPSTTAQQAGDTKQFAIVAKDAFNNVINDLPVTWSASPQAGVIQQDGLLVVGSVAGQYSGAITVTAGALKASASITITPAALDTIALSPNVTSMAAGALRQFTATGRDRFGNVITDKVFSWTALSGGTIESSGPMSAAFRAGTVTGVYPTALRVKSGSIERTAAVEVTQLVVVINASNNSFLTNGRQVLTFTVSPRDELGVPVGAGVAVTLTLASCPGSCSLYAGSPLAGATTVSGVTGSAGNFVAYLVSQYTSPTATLNSLVQVVAVAALGSNATQSTASVTGQFIPFRGRTPLVFKDFLQPVSGNHVACQAYRSALPIRVPQAPTQAFNMYRFRPTTASLSVTVTGYAAQGDLLLYRVRSDTCSANNQLSLEFVKSTTLSVGSFQTTFAGLNPQNDYLLAVYTKSGFGTGLYVIDIRAN